MKARVPRNMIYTKTKRPSFIATLVRTRISWSGFLCTASSKQWFSHIAMTLPLNALAVSRTSPDFFFTSSQRKARYVEAQWKSTKVLKVPNRFTSLKNQEQKNMSTYRSGDHFGYKGRLRMFDVMTGAISKKVSVRSIKLGTKISMANAEILEVFC